MADRSRYRGLSEEQLEGLVRGLPQRAPSPGLRDRILTAAATPPVRPTDRRRPAFAVAALLILVLADMLVLRQQGSPLRASAPSRSVAAQATPSEEISLSREFAAVGLPLRVALRTPAQPVNGLALRARMLTELGGG